RRGKPAQTDQLPLIFGVELAAIMVGDGPDRADRGPRDVKGHQQALFSRRGHGLEIGVPPFEVPEQQRAVAIEYVAAGTEIARGPAADVRVPRAGDRWPVEGLAAIVGRQQTDACGVGLYDGRSDE